MKKAAGVLLIVASCSWALMETVPKDYDPRAGEPRCSGSRGYGAWDLVLGVGHAALAIAAATSQKDAQMHLPDTVKILIGIDAVAGVLHLASASSGFKNAGACERARAWRDAYNRGELVDAGVDAPRMIRGFVDAAPADAGVAAVAGDALVVHDAGAPIAADARIAHPRGDVDTEEPPRR